MRVLTQINAVVLAIVATFALVLGVVCLMYAANMDASPRIRSEWPTVSRVTAVFWVQMAIAGLVFWWQRRATQVRWLAQVGLVGALWVGGAIIVRTLA